MNDIFVFRQATGVAGRPPGPPEPPESLEKLQAELPRDRALIAYRVAAKRCALKLTRSQLAGRAGVNQRQIEEIEAGIRDPQLSTVLKLARALKLAALDELLGPLPLNANHGDEG